MAEYRLFIRTDKPSTVYPEPAATPPPMSGARTTSTTQATSPTLTTGA